MRFGLRTFFGIVSGLCLLTAYVGTYYHLSRRGVAEGAEYEFGNSFLYTPLEETCRTEDLTRHRILSFVYAPANWIDRVLFGGPEPATNIVFRLAGNLERNSGIPSG